MVMQSSYNAAPPIAIEGMVATATRVGDTLSRVAHVAIAAGRLCVRQSEGKARLPTAAGDITTAGLVLGVSRYDAMRPSPGYAVNDVVAVLHNGVIWVLVEDAVTEGGAVYVRHTANGGATTIGGFRGTTDTGAALLGNATFRSSASAAGLAMLELNTP